MIEKICSLQLVRHAYSTRVLVAIAGAILVSILQELPLAKCSFPIAHRLGARVSFLKSHDLNQTVHSAPVVVFCDKSLYSKSCIPSEKLPAQTYFASIQSRLIT